MTSPDAPQPNYYQQPNQYGAPPQWAQQAPPTKKGGVARWLIPVAVGVVALLLGIGMGAAGSGTAQADKATPKPGATITETTTQSVTATVTATPPAPTATVTTTFTPTPAVAMSDGQFAVPSELQPGTYHTDGTETCYWEVKKDLTGDFGSIISNGNVTGPTTIQIPASAGGFSSMGGCAWSKVG